MIVEHPAMLLLFQGKKKATAADLARHDQEDVDRALAVELWKAEQKVGFPESRSAKPSLTADVVETSRGGSSRSLHSVTPPFDRPSPRSDPSHSIHSIPVPYCGSVGRRLDHNS